MQLLEELHVNSPPFSLEWKTYQRIKGENLIFWIFFYFCAFSFLFPFLEIISNLQKSDKNSIKNAHILFTPILTFCHIYFITVFSTFRLFFPPKLFVPFDFKIL